MKQAVVTISRKDLDQFEGQYKGSTTWFKVDSGFLKTTFSTIHSGFYKNLKKRILKIDTWNCIQRLLYRLMKNSPIQNMKKTKHDFSIRNTSARRNVSAQTSKRYILFVRSNGRNSFNRMKNSKCNARKMNFKEEENIKSRALSPFLPGNKRILNEENDNNNENTDTSKSEKYDMSHTSQDDSIAKVKDTINTNDDGEYKEDTLKLQDGNERVDNPETSDTLRDESVINKTK